jgi:hypothetical protein
MSNIHPDGCDSCGKVEELYHNEASGLAYCISCDGETDDERYEDEAIEAPLHEELRLIIEQAEGTDLAGLIPQAQALLALPEESVAALVAAAQSMVGAASFGR